MVVKTTPPAATCKQLPQVRAALGLHRRLAQEILAAREGAEELVVEVVAVGEHDDGRVLHRWLADDASGVEGHRQALARALRVPDHPDAPVTRLAAGLPAGLVASPGLGHPVGLAAQLGGPQRLAHCHPHRVELVVACHLLREPATAFVLEDDEVAHEVEEALWREDALAHYLQLRQMRIGEALARDGAPGLEPLASGGERANARLHPVGDDQQRVRGEERRDLGLVGLELLEGRPDGGVLVRRVLELHNRQWQAVNEEHDVRPAAVLVFRHGELVDRQPVVCVGVVEVQHPRLGAADLAVGRAVLHCHPVHEQAMHRAVAR